MKILHISDLHICASSDAVIYGVNPYRNLVRAVDKIVAILDIEFGILTGDVSNDGSEASYMLADSVLSNLRFPVYTINGNHDDLATMRSLAGGFQSIRMEDTLKAKDMDFIFIDTVWLADDGTNRSRGLFSPEARDKILQSKAMKKVVVMHHPATETGSWLDRRALSNREEFMEAIKVDGQVAAVLSGHNHFPSSECIEGCLFSTAPSVSTTFSKDGETFEEFFSPAFDILDMDGNGISKRTVYLNE